MPIKVIIADDHVFYREGVRALLGSAPEIDVIGEANNGDEAVTQASEFKPDVILMDLKMPGMNGIDATRKIHEAYPKVGVLVITMFDDDSVFAAMRAGARGYLLKDADKEEVVRAIVAVEKGEAIFSPAIAQRMIQYFSAAPASASKKNQPDEFAGLTERELEILDLIAQGHNNLMISNKLSLSIKIVQNYVSTSSQSYRWQTALKPSSVRVKREWENMDSIHLDCPCIQKHREWGMIVYEKALAADRQWHGTPASYRINPAQSSEHSRIP